MQLPLHVLGEDGGRAPLGVVSAKEVPQHHLSEALLALTGQHLGWMEGGSGWMGSVVS